MRAGGEYFVTREHVSLRATTGVFCRGERAKSRFERGLGLTVWSDGLNAAHVRDEDCQIITDLAPRADEYVIEKPRHGAFFQKELEPTLRKMNRDQVIVCGVFAHHGVMVSCIDGYMRNFQMTMVADALGEYSEPEHLDHLLRANHATGNSFILKCSLYKGKQPFMPITDLRLNEVLSPLNRALSR